MMNWLSKSAGPDREGRVRPGRKGDPNGGCSRPVGLGFGIVDMSANQLERDQAVDRSRRPGRSEGSSAYA